MAKIIISRQISAENCAKLKSILSNLSNWDRELVYLIYYQILDNAQIAELMNINRQSVCNLLHVHQYVITEEGKELKKAFILKAENKQSNNEIIALLKAKGERISGKTCGSHLFIVVTFKSLFQIFTTAEISSSGTAASQYICIKHAQK